MLAVAHTAAVHDTEIVTVLAAVAVLFAGPLVRLAAALAAVIIVAHVAGDPAAVIEAVVLAGLLVHRHGRFYRKIRRVVRREVHRAHRRQHRRTAARRPVRRRRALWARQRPQGATSTPEAQQAYYRTAEWRQKRHAALEAAGYRCKVHGCPNGNLDVHHNNNAVYDDLHAAQPSDLTVLCEDHHDLVTDLHKYRKNPRTHVRYTIAEATAVVVNGTNQPTPSGGIFAA
jgi:hypothetical protein